MLPDTIEHDFRRTGLRREAMFSAVYSVAEKLASAAGPFILGLVLSAAATKGGTAAPTAPGQPGTGSAVLIAAVVIPAIATALSAVALLFYGLDRELRTRDA